MSEENGKVCCNCRHNKRYHDEGGMVYCECQVSGKWLGYIQVMTGWCRHWAKERTVKVTTQERILIENTAAGARVAGELEKKFRQQGMFRGRSEDTAHIILETEYYSTIKEEDDEQRKTI